MTVRRSITAGVMIAAALALVWHPGADGTVSGDEAALSVRATVVGAGMSETLTITVFRWSTDRERAPFMTALAPLPPAPAAAEPAGGRGGGRGGRGRGGAAAAPATPLTRLAAVVRASPTVGYIWSGGVTGYSIKYAWRGPAREGGDRVVLVTDRRLGAHSPAWPPPTGEMAEADVTLIEMRMGAGGAGTGKASLMAGILVDPAAATLVLDGYDATPTLLEISR